MSDLSDFEDEEQGPDLGVSHKNCTLSLVSLLLAQISYLLKIQS